MGISPLVISIEVSIITTIISGCLGLGLGILVWKTKKFKGVLDGLFTLPMVLPPTIMGFFLLQLLGNQGPVGKWLNTLEISLLFTKEGMILAGVCVTFSLMYKSTLTNLQQLSPHIFYAAESLGLSKTRIFFQLLLPNIKEGILNGGILVFARSLGEFGATVMIAGNIPNKTQSMSLAIYESVQSGHLGEAYFWVTILVGFSFVSTGILWRVLQQKEKKMNILQNIH